MSSLVKLDIQYKLKRKHVKDQTAEMPKVIELMDISIDELCLEANMQKRHMNIIEK